LPPQPTIKGGGGGVNQSHRRADGGRTVDFVNFQLAIIIITVKRGASPTGLAVVDIGIICYFIALYFPITIVLGPVGTSTKLLITAVEIIRYYSHNTLQE
jgi:hypothetical protein